MRKYIILSRILTATAFLLLVISLGCSGNGNNPVTPSPASPVPDPIHNADAAATMLWGFYDVFLNPTTGEIDAVENRQAFFTLNVVTFLNNSKSAGLGFNINAIKQGPDYLDVDIDVTITHPFLGLTQYNGYDVRGVFMGDGSAAMEYNPDLIYPVKGVDQMMLSDPIDGVGGPDGYTRWFNQTEFSGGGMPMLQYTPGALASLGFEGTATLNPYKYYADGLGKDDDLWTWLGSFGYEHGRFSAGASNTRNYYIRFPNSQGIVFGYAVLADWGGVAPQYHPSNAIESIACKVDDASTLYYEGPGESGGNIILDVSLYNYHEQPIEIYLESTVLNGLYTFDGNDMTPVGGGENYSTYHVEIPSDNVTSVSGEEFWVVAEFVGYDYTNDFGVPNSAGSDSLAAFFRYGHKVSDTSSNHDPECDIQTLGDPYLSGCGMAQQFDASGSSDPDGDPISFTWDFNDDGVFDGDGDEYTGDADMPVHIFYESYMGNVCVKVSDDKGGEAVCCVLVDINVNIPTKNIDVSNPLGKAGDIAVDHNTGDVLVVYDNGDVRRYFADECFQEYETYDLDPNCTMIDIGHDGNFIIGYQDPSDTLWHAWHYNSALELLHDDWDHFQGPWVSFKDVFTMGQYGDYSNDHMLIFHWQANGDINPYCTALWGRYDEDNYDDIGYRSFNFKPGPEYGETKLAGDLQVAGESDRDDSTFWIVEREDCVAARFEFVPSVTQYVGPYFGVSQEKSDADDRIYEPIDLTRDNKNHYYILDHLSTGEYTIKAFSYDADSTTALGHFGQAGDWELTPVAIDGSDYDGNIVLLQTDGLDAKISVFTEDETSG